MPVQTETIEIEKVPVKNDSKTKTMWTVLLLSLLLLLPLIGFFVMNKTATTANNTNPLPAKNTVTPLSETSPKPSPFEFEEMTIPNLRQRTYQSQIAELKRYENTSAYTSFLTYYQSDGNKINALLTKPNGEEPKEGWPAIVFIHGYIPPNQYATTEKYIDYVDNLARSGFVVFKIDLRGHGDSEGVAGGGYYSSDYVIDALNAYSALQSTDFVNPKKIGMWGHSMAGNVVLRSIATKPEIPVVVIWGGAGFTYTDLTTYRISDLSYRPQPSDSDRQRKRAKLRELYGDPDPNNWFWKLVIPTNYLADYKGAIQLDHAVDDKTVNIEYSRNLNKILDTTKIPHELKEYPNGDHNITNPSFTEAMQNTIRYFNTYLKNE